MPEDMHVEDFDIQALHRAIDEKREALSMTWKDVAREVNAPLPGPITRSISTSTITGIRTRRSVEADGVLQILRWLDRTPESFCGRSERPEKLSAQLPALTAGSVLRFDARAIYTALENERSTRRMTWEQVAAAIAGSSASNLRRLERGGRVSFPQVMRVVRWLGRPASSFMWASPW